MAIRPAFILLILSLAVLCLVVACADQTRYEVLSFFFDGVPRPGEEDKNAKFASMKPAPDLPISSPRASSVIYYHLPYRQNRCQGCHSRSSGLLLRRPETGLCQTCHPDVPGDDPYLHGPVAVNNCLFCHKPHQASHPGLLIEDPRDLCFKCHNRQDLSTGRHHETIEQQPCLECHDPHGGDNRFFLVKRTDR